MSIAEKWLRNYWPDYESMVPQTMSMRLLLEYLDTVANSALELAAKEADKSERWAMRRTENALAWSAVEYESRTIAARIRALKSPAQEPESA